MEKEKESTIIYRLWGQFPLMVENKQYFPARNLPKSSP